MVSRRIQDSFGFSSYVRTGNSLTVYCVLINVNVWQERYPPRQWITSRATRNPIKHRKTSCQLAESHHYTVHRGDARRENSCDRICQDGSGSKRWANKAATGYSSNHRSRWTELLLETTPLQHLFEVSNLESPDIGRWRFPDDAITF